MDLNSSVLWGIIGLIATIVWGYVFYKKGMKKKSLFLSIDSKTLISETLTQYKGLRISYNKKNLKKLVSSTITIENTGNDTIDASDIAPASPITFSTTKVFLLTDTEDYKIYKANKNATITLNKINDSKVELFFDYLKPGDQIDFTLLHNGKVKVSGDLKNGKLQINDMQCESRLQRINRMKRNIIWTISFLLIFNSVAVIILLLNLLL